MANCKVSRLMKQELCRYCRTQVCEECFVAATSRNSVLQPEQKIHRHVCLSCTRLHPEEVAVRSPERHRRHGLPRLSSARPGPGHTPRVDSLSNMTREHSDRSRPRSSTSSSRFLAARKREQQPIGNSRKPSHRSSSSRTMVRTEEPTAPTDLELSMVDLRRRRHTTVITPSSNTCDFTKQPRGFTARDLLKANATELQSSQLGDQAPESRTWARDTSTSYSYDFTGSTPKMAIRNATSTDTKELELSMQDLQDVPKPYSCDFSGLTPRIEGSDNIPTEKNELKLSTVDLRLPKYKAKMPTDTTSSALTPVSFENLAAIEAKLTSVEFELQRYSVDKTTGTKKQSPQRPNTPGRSSSEGKSVSTTGSVDPADPEPMNFASQQEVMTLNRTRVVFDKETVAPWTMKMPIAKATGHSPVVKKQREPVDFHLSSVDLPPVRPRRHTATDTVPSRSRNSPSGNQELVSEKRKVKGLVPLRGKPNAVPIDFHLSTFNLKPRSRSSDAASPKSNQREVGQYQHHSKTKASSPAVDDGPLKTPKYAKHDVCDLSYLDNFRSYTV